MKKALLIASLVTIGGSVWGQDFTAHKTVTKEKPAKVVVTPPVDGAVQKAVRSGNPLQMLNPFAPHEYGNGSECVYYDRDDNFQDRYNHEAKPKGIRLFAFRW